jgi:hypothetical protein
MTHSLHRSGRFQEMDYVWLLYHVRGVNDQNLVERLQQAIDIAEEAGTVNWGDVKTGTIVSLSSEEIKTKLTEKSRIRGAFSSQGQVTQFLEKMREADLGLCVIIAGLLDKVFQSCGDAGLKPHTVNYSLGIFGKKELLPDSDTLALTTMCGHHMIPDGLVTEIRKKVRKKKISAEKAAIKLAGLCPCGIFNQERAARLLQLDAEPTHDEAAAEKE